MTRINTRPWGLSGKYTAPIIGYKESSFLGIVWRRKPIRLFSLDSDDPLTFRSSRTGLSYRPADSFLMDGGSIPRPAQCLSFIPGLDLLRDTWEPEYAIHDCGYMLHGLYIEQPGGHWMFTLLDKREIDLLLWESIKAGGGNATERSLIYWGVRSSFADRAWAHKEYRK